MQADPLRRRMPAPDPAICLTAVLDASECAVRDGLIRLMGSPVLSGLGEDLRATAEIVLAEVLNNVVEHAYAGAAGEIEVSLVCGDDGLGVRVADTGRAMPGEVLPAGLAPELGALEDLPEGGFGWFLIRTMTRDLAYRREGSLNVLSFLIAPDQA